MKNIKILVKPWTRGYIAQCLDYDIAAIGDDPNDAEYELERLIAARCAIGYIYGIDGVLSQLPPAPATDWERWEAAREGIPTPAEAREMSLSSSPKRWSF